MKEIESSRRESVESKKLRKAKQLDRAKQLAAPDSEPSAIDFERQLRKIATRGVVALFNAISKAKREAATEVSAKKDAGIKKTDVQVPTVETHPEGIKRGPPVGEGEGGAAGRRWAAVRDDYMVGPQLSAKVTYVLPRREALCMHVCIVCMNVAFRTNVVYATNCSELGQSS